MVQTMFPVVFVAFWLLAAVVIAAGFFSFGHAGPLASGPPVWVGLVPLGMVAIGGFVLVAMLRDAGQFLTSPIVGRPAILVAKRTAVSGGGENSSATTTYYATFEFERGDRRELHLDAGLFGQLSERDAGVLFTRHTLALDFDRIVE